MKKAGLIAIAVAVVAVAVVTAMSAYLLMPKGSPSGQVEISYNLQPGESYTYTETMNMDAIGTSMEILNDHTMVVVGVAGNQFDIRDTYTMTVTGVGTSQKATIVTTYKMSNKGARSELNIESVDPPELRENMGQTLTQSQTYFGPANLYPTEPVAIGQEWNVPLNLPLDQSGIVIGLVGSCTNSISGRESVTVRAGTFDSWRMNQKLNLASSMQLMGQTATISLSGDTTTWIDTKTGVQTKASLPLKVSVKAGSTEISMQITATMELVVYQSAKSST